MAENPVQTLDNKRINEQAVRNMSQPGLPAGSATMHESTEAIIVLEQRRCAAMCGNDSQALDALLHPSLYFCHSSGAIDDKKTYLAKMSQGRIIYHSIDWSDQAVTLLGGGAVLTGRMTFTVDVDGVSKRLDNRVMQVWREHEGQMRLFCFQSTPLAVS